MKTKYDNEPKALMQFQYDAKIVLPLSVAHQIQSLLQHAVALQTNWMAKNNTFNVLHTFGVPDVKYFDREEYPVYDATMLTKTETQAWTEEVKKALTDNDVENASRDLLPPENWKKLKVQS